MAVSLLSWVRIQMNPDFKVHLDSVLVRNLNLKLCQFQTFGLEDDVGLDLSQHTGEFRVTVQGGHTVGVQDFEGIDPAAIDGIDDVAVSAEQVKLTDRVKLIEEGLNQD